ncbi:MAG: sugar ABC transporter substrate-binding protein [Betaproteobacteria bacterium]
MIKTPHLAVFTKNYENPAYAAARLGAERIAAHWGAHVIHYVPQRADNTQEQQALVLQAIAAKPDACIFVAVDAEAMISSVEAFNNAQIPVFSFINRLLGGQVICHVGADDVALGQNIAQYLLSRLPLSARIVVLQGTAGSISGRDRLQGFELALQRFPNAQWIAQLQGEFLQDTAQAVFSHWLNKNIAFDAILAANDAMALGAIDALKQHQRPCCPIVGVNAVPTAISALLQGTLLATANFDAMGLAALATEAALRFLSDESVPSQILLPVKIIDQSQAQYWNQPFSERALPIWDQVITQSSS